MSGESEEIILYFENPSLGISGGVVNIKFQTSVPWVASCQADWVTLNNTSGAKGISTIAVNVDNNTGEPRSSTIVVQAGTAQKEITISQKRNKDLIEGLWYLGWWTSGDTKIRFNGQESITIGQQTLDWSGQQVTQDDGEYALQFAEDEKSFVISKKNKRLYYTIRMVTNKMLVFQENDTGPLRYWYRTKGDLNVSTEKTLPLFEMQNGAMVPQRNELFDFESIFALRQGITDSDITPMGVHYEHCHQTTDDDRKWLLDPANEPDSRLANENPDAPTNVLWLRKTVNLYPYGNPEPADINQHAVGDCSLCAVLASLGYLYGDYIKQIVTDNGDDTYTVSLYDPDGKQVKVCVNSKVLCDQDGNIAQLTGKHGEVTWGTIIEKALIKYQTLYGIDRIWGIGSEFAAAILTGDGRSFAYYANQLYGRELKTMVDWGVNQGMIGIGGFTQPNLQCGSLYSVTAHAFTLMQTTDTSGEYLFSMRNPWGIERVDGVLEIPDTPKVCSTIDIRLIYPGAAEPYLRKNRGGYVPPASSYARRVNLGVSKRLVEITGCSTVKPSPFYK